MLSVIQVNGKKILCLKQYMEEPNSISLVRFRVFIALAFGEKLACYIFVQNIRLLIIVVYLYGTYVESALNTNTITYCFKTALQKRLVSMLRVFCSSLSK